MKLAVSAFLMVHGATSAFTTQRPRFISTHLKVSQQQKDNPFTAFADSLDEDFENTNGNSTWQAKIDSLLDPSTPLASRQLLLSELLAANQEIRESVRSALSTGKIDGLLTPSQKKLQDGTRAVARQITNDILPSLGNLPPPSLPDLQLFPKIGSRVLEALSNQAKNTLKDIQGDLANPSRIPQRLTQQTEDIIQEAKNVFLETPLGLEGPAYTVVKSFDEYEIRDYQGYTVASTVMNPIGEPYKEGNLSSNGAAFNALAAYLFGANTAGKAMEMTTPVTTTSLGEMRFYLAEAEAPKPLDQGMYDTGAVQIVDIPPARLAVRKFTGFVTEGEVSRQKDVLLNNLALDGIEIDVPHGAVVPHVIFQYNPPYTVPMIRRNEIAVPVQSPMVEPPSIEEEWLVGNDVEADWGESPSDVE